MLKRPKNLYLFRTFNLITIGLRDYFDLKADVSNVYLAEMIGNFSCNWCYHRKPSRLISISSYHFYTTAIAQNTGW
jgi:hypothetical protein